MKAAGKKNVYPDFAFPKTVSKNAEENLATAIEKGNWPQCVEAAIRLVTADNLVSHENAVQGLQKTDSLSSIAPDPWKAAFLLIQADIYNSLYNSIRWDADGRKLPLDSVPSNPYEWSRDIFAEKTARICRKALDCDIKESVLLKEWSPIIENSADAFAYGMTVDEFIAQQCFRLLNVYCDETKDIIPFFKTVPSPVTPAQKCAELRDISADRLISESERLGQSVILAQALTDKTLTLPYSLQSKGFMSALEKVRDTEGEQLILMNMRQYAGDDRNSAGISFLFSTREYVDMMRKSISDFPKGKFSNALRNNVNDLTLPRAEIDFKSQYLSTDSIEMSVRLSNCNNAWFLIYDYSLYENSEDSPKTKTVADKCRLIKAVKASAEGTTPFEAQTTVRFGKLPYGTYVVIPSTTPDKRGIFPTIQNETWRNSFRVSDISITSLRWPDGSTRVFVVDGNNGAPISGATVKVYSQPNYREKKRLLHTLTTDKEGGVTVTEDRFEISASHKESEWKSQNRFYNSVIRRDTATRRFARILTDRSLCHPGDTIKAVIIGYSEKENVFSLNTGQEYVVSLQDANRTQVESCNVTTDTSGRSRAEFKVPEKGLLGSWRLTVTDVDGRQLGDTYFEVSEYVAPTFFITTEHSEDDITPGDVIRIKGQVMTYSGMPLQGADVKYSVAYNPPLRWFYHSGATFDSSVTTDSEGRYEIELPTENLKGTRFERGIFTLTISATSAAGETQSGPTERFAIGQEYHITTPQDNFTIDVSEGVKPITVNVIDMLGRKVKKNVTYRLTDDSTGKTVAEGKFESPDLRLKVKNLPSAKYCLLVRLEEDSLVSKKSDIVLWRDSDRSAPAGTGIWIPYGKISARPGENSVEVTLGSGVSDRWLPVVESGNDSIISFRWVHIEKDNVKISMPAPKGNTEYAVNVNSLSHLQNESGNVRIVPATERRLEVRSISFRDKISAGDRERWSFAFSKDSIGINRLPVMAVMTDAALNAINPFEWNFNPSSFRNPEFFSMRMYPARSFSQVNTLRHSKYLSYSNLSAPEVNDYGQGWGLGASYGDGVFYYVESAEDSGVVRTETLRSVKLTSKAMAPMEALEGMAAGVTANGISDLSDEAAIEEEKAEGSDESGIGGANDGTPLRDTEHPVAFFMPDLFTDKDGIAILDFIVPNFNTTWRLQVMGYDEELQTAKMSMEAVASKPVMVSVHSPRFVRTGDDIALTATIFNNSGDICEASARIELIDLVKGTVVAYKDFSAEKMENASSRQVEMSWRVPDGLSSVGFRAYAESGSHRDGEQALLPVLPATSPVVESTPFWISPERTNIEVSLPSFKETDCVTLQYCSNPAWYCLTALPSIVYPESKTVTSKMRALCGNVMAYGLISGNSGLKSGLQDMLSDRNSEFAALKSNLEKEGKLKISELNNTPWVNDASAETLRMSRLSGLLEDSGAQETIERLIKEVKDLQTLEGGWSWCPGMQPSPYMTRDVLRHFAMMAASGYLKNREETSGMIKRGIAYVDSETVADYKKYHKKGESLSYLLDWLFIRSKFPTDFLDKGKIGREMSGISEIALNDIAKEWKSMDIGAKSKAAILLWNSGKKHEASEILESLRQYASESEEKGMWFDNLSSGYGTSAILTTTLALEAFAEIQPTNGIVDRLRQWLILGRQTQDWGKDTYTVETINAILTSGTDWTTASEVKLPEIYLKGKKLDLPSGAAMTGAFTMTLDSRQASKKKLKISREATSPAWGGVISQYVSPIEKVKSASVPDISVSKRLVALVPGDGGILEPQEGIPLKKGMRVRVTLIVTVGRDMNYVALTDERSACLEPSDQLSGYAYSDGLGYYREVRDAVTNLFFDRLPEGHHVISYDCDVSQEGRFSCGIATVQSQYSPLMTSHSGGEIITVEK